MSAWLALFRELPAAVHRLALLRSSILALVLLLPCPRAQALTRADCDAALDRAIRSRHLDPERVPRDAICRGMLERAAAGQGRSQLEDFFHAAIRKVDYAFATPGRAHDRTARYRFPFDAWMPRLLSQASGGETHTGLDQYHAFDFLMPTGTNVLAAREGTVVRVADGTPEGVPWEEDGGNHVTILHEDGSWGVYLHLQIGVPVKVGQTVRRGAVIGRSGNTGFSRTPHLHFGVQQMDLSGEVRAVPVRFGKPGQPGQVPEAGRHWGQIPRSRRELRVFVDGEPSRPDRPRPIRWGTRAALRVERVDPDGSVVDVSTGERMRYETMTVWNLYSPERGRLVVEGLPEIDVQYIRKALPLLNQSEGLLFVYHGLPWEPDFGIAQVPFQVLPAEP